MGKLTNKVKKKKSRKTKAKLFSLIAIAVSIAFLHAASSVYLREVYNVKTLFPSWEIAKNDIIFQLGDLMVLDRDVGLKMLVDTNLLVAEQVRQIALFLLIGVLAHMTGKGWFDRISLFLFIGGLSCVLYYLFLFALLRWPTSLLAKDVITLLPTPVIVSVYMPLLLSALAFTGSIFLVLRKK